MIKFFGIEFSSKGKTNHTIIIFDEDTGDFHYLSGKKLPMLVSQDDAYLLACAKLRKLNRYFPLVKYHCLCDDYVKSLYPEKNCLRVSLDEFKSGLFFDSEGEYTPRYITKKNFLLYKRAYLIIEKKVKDPSEIEGLLREEFQFR